MPFRAVIPSVSRVLYDDDDEMHRISPSTKRHQERRINPDSGREKWFDVPEPFTPAPKQLWVSDVIEQLRPLFFSKRRIIGHNVKFDVQSLAKYFGAAPPGPYGDTVVAAKLVDENEFDYKLGSCVKRAFKYEYAKIGKKGPENFPYSEAHLYSYLDAKYDWLLWRYLQPRLDRQQVREVFDLEMRLLPVLIDMETTGTPIDEEQLDALGDEFEHEMARLKVSIDRCAGREINLNANRQVAELVYDILGHECTVFTKTRERSTSAETLSAFSFDPTIERMQEHAKLASCKARSLKASAARCTTVECIRRSIRLVQCRDDSRAVSRTSSRSPHGRNVGSVCVTYSSLGPATC